MLLIPLRIFLIPRLPFTNEELAILDGPTASPFVSRCSLESVRVRFVPVTPFSLPSLLFYLLDTADYRPEPPFLHLLSSGWALTPLSNKCPICLSRLRIVSRLLMQICVTVLQRLRFWVLYRHPQLAWIARLLELLSASIKPDVIWEYSGLFSVTRLRYFFLPAWVYIYTQQRDVIFTFRAPTFGIPRRHSFDGPILYIGLLMLSADYGIRWWNTVVYFRFIVTANLSSFLWYVLFWCRGNICENYFVTRSACIS